MSDVVKPPPDSASLPRFDHGWVLDDGQKLPYLSYVDDGARVNWSDDLEDLHEESSRTHFIDVWTRGAMLERLGSVPVGGGIADLGCSTGYLLEDLRAAYPEALLYGLDLVAPGLAKAHGLVPDARLLRADVCALPFADASLDAVVSANLLEHVPDDVLALKEMARALRSGGRAVIVIPAGPGTYDYYDRFLGHERRYGRGELAGKAREAGFEVLEDAYLGSILYPAFWATKKRNRRRHDHLSGEELERKVAHDIDQTQSSKVGEMTCRLERGLLRRRVRIPFGVRGLVALRKI
ncbi:MAG TPA: class I SAM-dependent methyltransferase [Solirubrobacterales bacterium]|nr:class I SAM-dependent methyltransferase [Solirubrobacterales bacterium]